MSYATLERMTARFGERELIALTDTDEGAYTNTINIARLQAAMDMANSEVDGYVMARYAVPVANPPLFLVGIACDMARYHAAVSGARVTERDEVRYKAAIKSLESIAAGKLQIGASPVGGRPAPASANDVVVKSVRGNDFGNGGW